MSTTTAEYSHSAAIPVPVRIQAWIAPVATWLVLGAAYGPLLARFFVSLWTRSHYQYFPFVIVAFLWLLWRNASTAQPRQADSRRFGYGPLGLLVVAWLLLALAYVANSPWLAMVSAIVLIASRLWKFSTNWKVKYLWGIWAILWLIVPLPLNRDQQLIVALQHLSSRLSSIFLDVAAVEHLMDGNTLLLPTKQLFVDEACSGIVSVLSVIACAVIYGVWRNRSPVHVVGLAVAGVGWATLMNVLRITIIALLLDRTGVDWSSGTPHEILSLVIFAFILLGLVSTDLLLTALLQPIGPTWEQFVAAQAHFGQSVVRWWDRLIANPEETIGMAPLANATPLRATPSATQIKLRAIPLAAFALLAALQFTALYRGENLAIASFSENQQVVQRASACSAETLPAAIGSLKRAKFLVQTRDRDDVLGNYSRTYEYRGKSDVRYVASCDFPYFGGWHELTECYRGQGWQLRERRVETEKSQVDGPPWQYMQADFARPDGTHGFLMASAFGDAGEPLELPTNSIVEDALSALTSRKRSNHDGLTFQVQVWTTASRPITQAEREATRQLFLTARQQFFKQIAGADSSVAVAAH